MLILRIVLALLSLPLIGLAAEPRQSRTNTVVPTATNSVTDPVALQLRAVMEADDLAHEEVDRWIKEANAAPEGAGGPRDTLELRIRQRFDKVKTLYENFLRKHPKHAEAHLAFGGFLDSTGDEEGALKHWEESRKLDPTNPAVWNNLANYYGHRGPVAKAFEYYAKAISLDPTESTYFFNLAGTVYLFRKDAMEIYKLTEQQVFDKALTLYREAMKLDPDNFVLASEYAQSFYGTNPARNLDGLLAWQEAMKLARTPTDREGILIHYARVKINMGRYDDGAKDLAGVTNEVFASTKRALTRKLEKLRSGSTSNDASPRPD